MLVLLPSPAASMPGWIEPSYPTLQVFVELTVCVVLSL
jgi:hypothetical protein